MEKETTDSYPALALPAAPLELRGGGGRRGPAEVYDLLRKKWLALTPEEWVRQHFVWFLQRYRNFPSSLIANEYGISLNGTIRRCDSVVFDRTLRPLAICEYKAPSVAVTQKVFDQISRYNIVLHAPYLFVSNGLRHYCCRFGDDGYTFLPDIPDFDTLTR